MAVVNDLMQLAAKHLLFAIEAEQLDERHVADGDEAMGIDGVEAFAGRVQKAAGERLAFQPFDLGAAALMDVLRHQYPMQQATVMPVNRRAAALEPAWLAGGVEQRHFETAGFAALQRAMPLLQHRVPVVRCDGSQPAHAS